MTRLGTAPANTYFPKTQTITASATRAHTFAVDSSVDYGYEFHVHGVLNRSGDTGNHSMRLQPNGDGSGTYSGLLHTADYGGAYTQGVTTTSEANGLLVFATDWSEDATFVARGLFMARGIGSGVGRPCESTYASVSHTNAWLTHGKCATYWSHPANTTNVTSLVFQMSGAATTFTGRIVITPLGVA